jgi:fimbrial chaperone protein
MYSFVAQSTGVSLGATRIIYPADAREVSLSVTNSNKNNQFLIQTWIDNRDEKKTTDFIVTPPLFVAKPESETTLRIMYVGDKLPKDRETLYWLSSKSIPSVDYEKVKDINVLQIAVLSRIKLFVRPEGLPISSIDAAKKLTFKQQGNKLVINNDSPYFITIVNLKIGTSELPAKMVPPKDQATLMLPSSAIGPLSYQTINDYGAKTPRVSAKLE